MHRGAGVINRKVPAVAGDIPEKFVVILVEAELASGGVGDGIDVAAARDHCVLAAQIDALAVELVLHSESLGGGIAGGGDHLEADDVFRVEGVGVARGEIAIDAVADAVASGKNGDGLCDEQRGVLLEPDVAVKVEDAFGLPRQGNAAEQSGKDEDRKSTRL